MDKLAELYPKPRKLNPKPSTRKSNLTHDQHREMLNKRFVQGYRLRNLAELYDMHISSVAKICTGETYTTWYNEFVEATKNMRLNYGR